MDKEIKIEGKPSWQPVIGIQIRKLIAIEISQGCNARISEINLQKKERHWLKTSN